MTLYTHKPLKCTRTLQSPLFISDSWSVCQRGFSKDDYPTTHIFILESQFCICHPLCVIWDCTSLISSVLSTSVGLSHYFLPPWAFPPFPSFLSRNSVKQEEAWIWLSEGSCLVLVEVLPRVPGGTLISAWRGGFLCAPHCLRCQMKRPKIFGSLEA